MHMCVFDWSDHPVKELSLEELSLPANALDTKQCKSMINGHWQEEGMEGRGGKLILIMKDPGSVATLSIKPILASCFLFVYSC